MQAVGKIGSYIGRSVYTVSGPFHPFGGAVDIIVVEQPDGTYKSSPWYVRFGKFQGVLKTREKVVSISVNGVKSDFHMYLDHKGEAFFLKEVDLEIGESGCSTPYSSDDSLTGNDRDSAVGTMTRTNSRRAQILGLVFGRKLRKEKLVVREEENTHDFVRTASLERAEIAADLLDLKWSTNLASSRVKRDKSSQFSAVHMQNGEVIESPVDDSRGGYETSLVSTEPNKKLESTVGENEVEECSDLDSIAEAAYSVEGTPVQTDLVYSKLLVTDKLGIVESDFHVSSTNVVSEISQSHSQIQESVVNLNSLSEGSGIGPMQYIDQSSGSLCCGGPGEACAHTEAAGNITLKSEPGRHAVNEQDPLNIQECLRSGDQERYLHEETLSVTGGTVYGTSESTVNECLSQSVSVHQSKDSLTAEDSQSVVVTCLPAEQQTVFSRILGSEISPEEQLMFGNLDDYGSSDGKPWKCDCADQEPTNSSFSSTVTDGTNEGIDSRCAAFSLEQSIIDDYINDANPQRRKSRSISSDISSINETGHARPKELIRMVRSLPTMELANDGHQLSGAQAMDGDFKSLKEGREGAPKPSFGKSKSSADAFGGRRRGWSFSFKRSRTARVSHMDMKGGRKPREEMIPDSSNFSEVGNGERKVKAKRKVIKMLTPTSEQLASLNLKEGKNAVVFTFSTAMLGNQQVDARIFLWKWDTRIVISDVDGTITRSDLLGQVMPLVGMDWSQTGVAHLFSAIKENGYQLLFLSARSISQSFHTRQFLCNMRQDGKALPEGPVVISPDGLFPSLFREVVRRAPHEFKIGCLEDIKALFPADRNPFYAGFGNRDTDEFTYLKVGIPRGKIFTINPKGEIVVNRHVHTKTYRYLHDLVHGMFPIMTSFEQEDYNSWNYWKLPPPLLDL